jgi:hypothetical protein
MNNSIIRFWVLLILLLQSTSYVCSSDGNKQIAALEYVLQNVTKAKPTIFEDQYVLDMIKEHMNNTKAWLAQELTKNSDKTLKKASIRIQEAANHIYNDLKLFSSNIDSIKTGANVRAKFRKDVNFFSQFRDVLKKELESSSSLQKLKKQKFPLISKAKKEIADVLLAYADSFSKIAQQAITEFARIDGNLFIEEKNAEWPDWDNEDSIDEM